jgi:hypothetical protein
LIKKGRCAEERSSERKNLHGTFRRLMKVGGFFVLLVRRGSREATADEVAEYLARSPHWAHLMQLTLEMGWKDVHLSLAKL